MTLTDAERAALDGATIVLDLDGTLVDTAPDLVGTLNLMLAEEGLPTMSLADIRPMIGHGAMAMMARAFEAAGEPLPPERAERLFDRFIPAYVARIADESRPFAGCVEALTAMRDAGAILAVCTNKRTEMSVALLQALGMAPLFAAIVGPDAADARKPDARHIAAAVAQAGGRLDRAVMVGDSDVDAAAARATGVPLVLVSFGYTQVPVADLAADALIDQYADLPAACARLLAPCPA